MSEQAFVILNEKQIKINEFVLIENNENKLGLAFLEDNNILFTSETKNSNLMKNAIILNKDLLKGICYLSTFILNKEEIEDLKELDKYYSVKAFKG